jgi:hypothetical protein
MVGLQDGCSDDVSGIVAEVELGLEVFDLAEAAVLHLLAATTGAGFVPFDRVLFQLHVL